MRTEADVYKRQVVTIEAMKMEIPVVAPKDGTVASINVSVGDAIEAGALLATLNCCLLYTSRCV